MDLDSGKEGGSHLFLQYRLLPAQFLWLIIHQSGCSVENPCDNDIKAAPAVACWARKALLRDLSQF